MSDVVIFGLLCGLMLLVALAWVLWPLWRSAGVTGVESAAASPSYSIMAFVSICVLMVSAAMYVQISRWPWGQPAATSAVSAAQAAAADAQAEITAFQARVTTNPDDLDGWLQLGSAQVRGEQFAAAQGSFQRAYELSQGKNIEAITGLAEALVLVDPVNANGRAGVLIDEALKLDARQPKALWYGGLLALQLNNFQLARERFKALLDLNPPDNVRVILDNQIARLDEQLGIKNQPAAESARQIVVSVSLDPALKARISQPMSLFVLARNPGRGGPPLAVERHQSSELPLKVELTSADAMLPQLSIDIAEEVEVVARLSASGTPTEQPGDYVGVARYSFGKQGSQGAVDIVIKDQVR